MEIKFSDEAVLIKKKKKKLAESWKGGVVPVIQGRMKHSVTSFPSNSESC